jgi:hypothetical protein
MSTGCACAWLDVEHQRRGIAAVQKVRHRDTIAPMPHRGCPRASGPASRAVQPPARHGRCAGLIGGGEPVRCVTMSSAWQPASGRAALRRATWSASCCLIACDRTAPTISRHGRRTSRSWAAAANSVQKMRRPARLAEGALDSSRLVVRRAPPAGVHGTLNSLPPMNALLLARAMPRVAVHGGQWGELRPSGPML